MCCVQSGCLACQRIGEDGNPGPGPDLTHVGSTLTRHPDRSARSVHAKAPMPIVPATCRAKKAAAQGAAAAYQGAYGKWSRVRASRRRHGRDLPSVPVSDFGNAVSELWKSSTRAYPTGSKQGWEEAKRREAVEAAAVEAQAKRTTRESSLSPLMEIV